MESTWLWRLCLPWSQDGGVEGHSLVFLRLTGKVQSIAHTRRDLGANVQVAVTVPGTVGDCLTRRAGIDLTNHTEVLGAGSC